MEFINEKECPSCKNTNTKPVDATYNCETRRCNACKIVYEVRFKQVATSVKIVPR